MTFLTFFTFLISDPEKNILTAENIFVSMSLFYTMHLPLGLLPLIIVAVIEVVPQGVTHPIYLRKRLWFFSTRTTNYHTSCDILIFDMVESWYTNPHICLPCGPRLEIRTNTLEMFTSNIACNIQYSIKLPSRHHNVNKKAQSPVTFAWSHLII